MADYTIEELERLEKEFRVGSNNIKNIKEFTSPDELYQELIASIRKYHPSADISLVEKAYRVRTLIPSYLIIFERYYDSSPIRKVSISAGGLTKKVGVQLNIFETFLQLLCS